MNSTPTVSRRPAVGALAALALAGLALPRSAVSQQPVEIAGRLLDAGTGAPIATALVSIPALDISTLTNVDGAFHLVVPAGLHTFEIRHIGYGMRTTEVEAPDGTLSLEIRIEPAAIEVAPLEVNVEWRPSYLEQVGFYERRAHGLGRFYDPEDIRRGGDGLIVGWRNLSERILNISRVNVMLCAPQIIIDGRRDRVGLMTGLAHHRLGGVEVHGEPHKVPGLEPRIRAAGENPFCPTVIVWTRQWLTAAELEERRIVLCEPGPTTERAPLVVEGTVTDALTGILLPRATVTAWITEPGGRRREKETTADDNGRFRFCDLDPRMDVSIWARFAGLSGELAPVAGETARVAAETAPVTANTVAVMRDLVVPISRHGHVAGRVLDLRRGEPVPGAEIRLAAAEPAPAPGDRPPSAEARHPTTSDEHGFFAIPDLVPGDYRLAVSHPDAGVAADTIPVHSGSTVDVRVELDPAPPSAPDSASPDSASPAAGRRIVAERRHPRLTEVGFYERRRESATRGRGHFFTPERIRALAPTRLTDVLTEVDGLRELCPRQTCRPVSRRARRCSHMSVYLNGALVMDGRAWDFERGGVDDLAAPHEVAAIEVYLRSVSLPGEFTAPADRCGAIIIWSG
ncbi:MAG: carboxypeptidase regulatory-like domain-containing protein [Gemmatimonadota bacterium]|uniref:carboxypeptidase regulatory-like domain-containing protein n=1 Tax=Candidatus Palauibacter scopulicola TaxID=3056741 RepID=UPI0023847B78|nr:carboxypeptidase regulatory-like domain-containing protein [Candidatus Palauibacter scopulicola]MDE2662358.1 carboxypeptidase regulatory-like domain-containing protein [Candidatus Palauibacter scopulicola]